MTGGTKFEQFKDREFKGDILLSLIVSDLMLQQGVKRSDVRHTSIRFVSNEHLAHVFDRLNLDYHPDDISHLESQKNGFKRKGNTVEHHIWEYFEQHGYTETVEYLRPFIQL